MSVEPFAPHELEVGQVFEGKYKILRELGRGGFGMVYLAFQQGMDRHVALKVLKSNVSQTAPSAKERFLREVKIISKLKHPNTVTIHDFGETLDGGLYMVLEYVEGETLKQVLKREGAQDPLRAADLGRQIAKSLSEAHRHGVVHRDLKPANIMITNIESDKDFVKVLDFGVARLLDPKTNDLTSVGLPEGERELIGTPRYMSPEQVRGESLTGCSDIYSLGLMLYEMLVGEPAVLGDTTMGLITQQISPEPLRLPFLPNLQPRLQEIIRIATAKPVQDRFQTAEQMADALEEVVFFLRRENNMSGPQSNDMLMQSYQSQLVNMQQQGGPGWQQQLPAPPWSGGTNTPSGNWVQQTPAYNDPRQPSGQYPPGNYAPGMPPQYPAYPQGQGMPPGQQSPPMGPGHAAQAPHPPHPQQRHPSGALPGVDASGYPAARPTGHGPQAPGSHPFAFDEIELPDDEDYKSTVERDALDPRQDIARVEAFFERNQHPHDDLPQFQELPPPPVDDRPFEVQEEAPVVPEPQQPKPAPRPKPAVSDEGLIDFGLAVGKVLVLSSLAGLGTYFAFLVLGAMLGEFLDSRAARLVAALVGSLAVPVIVGISEGNQDRFAVVERPLHRISRVMIGTIIFSSAATILISAAMANAVVKHLRAEPNWFLSQTPAGAEPSTEEAEALVEVEPGLAGFNRKVSYSLGNIIVKTAGAVGLYKPTALVPGSETRLPPRTRQTPPENPEDEVGDTPEEPPSLERRHRLPPPTRPQTQQRRQQRENPKIQKEEEDSDYVRW